MWRNCKIRRVFIKIRHDKKMCGHEIAVENSKKKLKNHELLGK